ncbi:MAG: helix-turn-helix transcriptional regulator [bacterium]|nr:helix-turn-helix transcriptional regulator [bacterium]
MLKHDRALLQGAGLRLRAVREQLRFSPVEMAARMGIKTGGYYKNENGETFMGMRTMDRLQKDFDISMDWLIFNKGPMYFKEKHPGKKDGTTAPGMENNTPEMKELFNQMEQDPRLRHEVLAYYYKYKERRVNTPVEDKPEATWIS